MSTPQTRLLETNDEKSILDGFESKYADLAEREPQIKEDSQRQGLLKLFAEYPKEEVVAAIIAAERKKLGAKQVLIVGDIMNELRNRETNLAAHRDLFDCMREYTKKFERWLGNSFDLSNYSQWIEDIALLRTEVEEFLQDINTKSNQESTESSQQKTKELLQKLETLQKSGGLDNTAEEQSQTTNPHSTVVPFMKARKE